MAVLGFTDHLLLEIVPVVQGETPETLNREFFDSKQQRFSPLNCEWKNGFLHHRQDFGQTVARAC